MKKKSKNKIYTIVGLTVLLLSMAVGYAIFSGTLNITGTATSTGTYNISFFATSITASADCTPVTTLSADKKTITISVPDLQKPGAFATISATVKNTGSISATLLSVNVTGNTDPNVTVTYPTWTTGVVLAAGESYTFPITVTWASTSTVTGTTVPFTAALNYQQTA